MKKSNCFLNNFVNSGKASCFAGIINVVFAIAGFITTIISLTASSSPQMTATLVIELLLFIVAFFVGGIMILLSLKNTTNIKINYILFVINAFLLYFSSRTIIAFVYILCGFLIVLDIIKFYNNKKELEEIKQLTSTKEED